MASEGLPVQVCYRVLMVSQSGFHAWRSRPPSVRAIRHAWLTDVIRQVHTASRQTSRDLVQRQFARTGPDQLWVTDITDHPTREGKLYCAIVLDACSRRVVG